MDPIRIAVFVSGRGSNLRAIHQTLIALGDTSPAILSLCLSNKTSPAAFEYCRDNNIPTVSMSQDQYPSTEEYGEEMLRTLRGYSIGLIVLAGYLRRVPELVVKNYRGCILNVHPALLPKYGGKGMYGKHVHQAVIDAGETESGVTVHLADEEYDEGAIIAQERIPVLPDDTPETLSERTLEIEHSLYPRTIVEFATRLLTYAHSGHSG